MTRVPPPSVAPARTDMVPSSEERMPPCSYMASKAWPSCTGMADGRCGRAGGFAPRGTQSEQGQAAAPPADRRPACLQGHVMGGHKAGLLEDDHLEACGRQVGGSRPAARAAAHDDHVAVQPPGAAARGSPRRSRRRRRGQRNAQAARRQRRTPRPPRCPASRRDQLRSTSAAATAASAAAAAGTSAERALQVGDWVLARGQEGGGAVGGPGVRTEPT